MIFVVILIGLLFIGTAYLVTQNNAKYLLAGYNTMSDADRAKVNLDAYIPKFRNFHLVLGISTILIGLLINTFFSETILGLFLGFYPILAYLYFFYETREFKLSNKSKNGWKLGAGVMVLVLVFLTWIFYTGLTEDTLIIENDTIILGGSYGESISKSEIKTIDLMETSPKISKRVNGFSLGDKRKGYYKTSNEGRVKLILNDRKNLPYIKIVTQDEQIIYYSLEQASNSELYEYIKNELDL